MVIFHSYVSLPEGTGGYFSDICFPLYFCHGNHCRSIYRPPTLHRFTILHLKRLNDIFHSHLARFTSHLALLEPRCDQATAKNLRCAYLTAGHKEVELPVELPDLRPWNPWNSTWVSHLNSFTSFTSQICRTTDLARQAGDWSCPACGDHQPGPPDGEAEEPKMELPFQF